MEVSGFKIKRTIGQGGMGTVYLATQESLDRDVCLKTMNASRSDSAEYFERFLNALQLLVRDDGFGTILGMFPLAVLHLHSRNP